MRDVEPGNSSAVVVSEKSKILRRVFWSDETNGFMRRHVATRGIEGAQFDDMLFVPAPKYGSEALNARSVQRMLRRGATSAGIAGRVVPHSFRHSYIHRLASVGTPDAVIAQMIGHRPPLPIPHYPKLSRPEMQSVANQRFVEIAA